MLTQEHIVINGIHHKPIVIDTTYPANAKNLPIIIFCHGYKGFKDWGAWNLMASAFARAGYYFVKFNFSHNGGTIEQPIDFPDLEAFGNNNYTKELDDLATVIEWLFNNTTTLSLANLHDITLMGHSRGGGIVIIKAEEDSRIKQVIALASVSDFETRMNALEDASNWKKYGVTYIENSRTKQKMPHYFQFYENFIENKERLNIQRAIKNLSLPLLLIHGSNDTSVSVKEAEQLKLWQPEAELKIINGANHVFGAQHPWEHKDLPKNLEEAVKHACNFLANC
ncbi:alpha/beta hydrolase family protein [Gaetbulibacter saemankumensis]|uniref:alpha/beta hydrolase family protein n=1 Tax=Gaetbulibacter saemankumensis TaxID=311208 RepID=UPI0004021CC3|nr:alpha/beta fold hydrolase [Gaetbulibacter saemankumensis]